MFGAKQATGTFSFGSPATATSTAPLFGAQSTTTPRPLFGAAPQQQSTPSLFGGAPASGGSLFGAAPAASSTAPSLFGAPPPGGLFSKPAATTNFGATSAFGAKPLFGAAAAAPAPVSSGGISIQALIQNSDALVSSVCRVELYGDERDKLLTRLNQLAAAIGVGSGLYKKDFPAIPYNFHGPFFRLKAIGYNTTSCHSEEEGLVSLVLRVPHSSLSSTQQRQALLDAFFAVLDSRPELKPYIHLVQALHDNCTKVVVYVIQRGLGRVKATQLASFFQQPNKKAMLENNLKVDGNKISPLLAIDSQQRRIYLKTVPQGFDQAVWDQALKENPDPEKLIPYPIRGFQELRLRQRAQAAEVEAQKSVLENLSERCEGVECSLSAARNRLSALRATQKQLSHRLLRIMALQMMTQRFAHGIDQTEEEMQTALENINVRLNAPNHIKNQLADMLEEVKEVGERPAITPSSTTERPLCSADTNLLKRYLARCQDGLESLVDIVNKNQNDLRIMEAVIN